MTAPKLLSASTVQRAVIEGFVPANVANQRIHWSTKHKQAKAEQALAYWHAKQAHWTSLDGRVRLTMTMGFQTGPLPDHDNAVARCKNIVDGLKGAFFADDSPKWLDLEVRTVRGPKQTTLELEAIA